MSIRPEEYYSAETFAREQERIFGGRLFVGSAGRFNTPDAYRAYRAGGRALVTRHVNGHFHTLENVCLHRGNLIHPLGYGEKPLRCGYHGWQYHADGALRHAPLADAKCIKRHQLQGFPTANQGGLLFADLQGRTPELAAPRRALEAIGFELDPLAQPFHTATLPHEANWKLLVENVLEPYHLSFVHSATFVAQGFTSTTEYDWAHEGDCSWNVVTPKPGSDAGLRRLIPQARGGYAHAWFAPNLFVSVSSGLVAFVSHFLPTSAGATLLDYELWETPLLMRQKNAIRDYVKEEAVRFTAAVLDEDRALLETSQQGIEYAREPHQLQPIEARIGHFHQIYREAMDAA
jgi:phenylpropionate dioxygenase-like ring-hydroxylating dioxygenase large terminal subunit